MKPQHLLATGLLLVATALADQPKVADDVEGSWRVSSIIVSGRALPVGSADQELHLVFRQGKVWLQVGQAERQEEQFTYKVDAGTTPKILDLIEAQGSNKGRVLEGIYQRTGDKLTLCIREPSGVKERPAEFESKDGSSAILVQLEKVKS